ncbi:MAG TPA: hypothetical protein VEA59_03045 [Patescibacteria group bacterium]|nr:hypothetical protein [Patescibacteria group bacterium]
MTRGQVLTTLQIIAAQVLGTSISGVPMDRVLSYTEQTAITDAVSGILGVLIYDHTTQVTLRVMLDDYSRLHPRPV